MPYASTISEYMHDTENVTIHDRKSSCSSLLYPVISRRAGGLSLGVNLFPDAKRCSFDCPYCEVHPFVGDLVFSPARLESELQDFFIHEYPRNWKSMKLKDLCLSGNGEPTLSPHLQAALAICAQARGKYFACEGAVEALDRPKIVLITNATGFLNPQVSEILHEFVKTEDLVIWAKLDAGSNAGFSAMSRSGFDLGTIVDGLASFAMRSPIVIQTMLCSLHGVKPGVREAIDYAITIKKLLDSGSNIKEIHFYTVARTPLEPWVAFLEDAEIIRYMEILRSAISTRIPLYGFGARNEGPLDFKW